MSDQQIIESIRTGSEEQLKDLYVLYKNEFVAWLNKTHQCNTEDALEIFQLSVVLLYDNIIVGKLTTLSSSLKSYLFAIGKNKAKELKRRQSRFGFEIKEELIAHINEDEDLAAEKEIELTLMDQALNILGGTCKQLLEMFYYQNLSMQVISEKMNYNNAGTAKNMKYKCLKRLQKIFTEQQTTKT